MNAVWEEFVDLLQIDNYSHDLFYLLQRTISHQFFAFDKDAAKKGILFLQALSGAYIFLWNIFSFFLSSPFTHLSIF